MNRLLAIDYGKKRIGIAVSDPLGISSQPVAVISNDKNTLVNISALIDKYQITKLVVGMPKRLNNEMGQSAEEVLSFVEKMKKYFNLEIITFDERMTTAQAQKTMIENNADRRTRKENIDKIAAAILLQDYMSLKGVE